MNNLIRRMRKTVADYKENVLGVSEQGVFRGKPYRHILPRDKQPLNLWEDIREDAIAYFGAERIAWHKDSHNLLNSQALCVNLFFPLREELALLTGFFSNRISGLAQVNKMHFEYIGPEGTDYLHEGGSRGQNRTSADVALEWDSEDGTRGLLLLEFKFTEGEFGRCGGAASKGNTDQSRCLRSEKIIRAPSVMCYLVQSKKRPYWDIILDSDGPLWTENLTLEQHCPFRYDFYQLMRNQLLAHQIERDQQSGFARALFGVVYHRGNDRLLRMGHPYGGERNPLTAWASMLKQPESFVTFTIQDLLNWIDAELPGRLHDWRNFLRIKYGL
jgi:hypothetical protein